MRTASFRLVLAALLTLTVASCRTGGPGEEGALRFSYAADEVATDLDVPIARGAQLDLLVEDLDTLAPLTVGSATSDDPAILEVVSVDRATITLRGVSEGRTRVRVSAMRDGQIVADSLELSVAPAERIELSHGCPGGEDGVYLASSRIFVPFELERADGSPVVGYGLAPIGLDPPGALALDDTSRSLRELVLRTGPSAMRATIASTLDDSRLVIDIVEERELDGATLRLGALGSGVDLHATRFVLAQAAVNGRPLCQGAPAMDTIEETPEVCDVLVVRELRTDDDARRTYGWLQVTGLTQGTCRFRVRYPAADLEVPFTMSVR